MRRVALGPTMTRLALTWKDEGDAGPVMLWDVPDETPPGPLFPMGREAPPTLVRDYGWMTRHAAELLAAEIGVDLHEW